MEALYKKRLVAQSVYLDSKIRYTESSRELVTQNHRREELELAQLTAKENLENFRAKTLADVAANYREARKQYAEQDLILRKASKRELRNRLSSPVGGTVQQLSTRTVGGVVQQAQVLMIVVPDDVQLEAQVAVENKDRGFVREGQDVEIKLDAFPFTKYGTVPGTIKHISKDSIETEEQEQVTFDSRIALSANKIWADGQDMQLSPGMTVTASILTGKRRVIEFLIAPLLRYQDEAIRDR